MRRVLLFLFLLALPGRNICQQEPARRIVASRLPTTAQSRPSLAPHTPLAVDQQAKVFSVDGAAKNTYFALPQVRLVNLTAARRINQTLVEYFNSTNGDTLPRTAGQAVRAAEALFQENNEQGFRGYEFQVLYNAHGVLSLGFAVTELSEHELITGSYTTFDLRTGRQMPLAKLIADTTALRRNWKRQVNESVAESVERARGYFGKDSASLAYFKERVNWDDHTHAVRLSWEPDFALTPDGLSLFCRYDLPLSWAELQPQGEYPFAWERLRPWWQRKGPWRTLMPYMRVKKHSK